MKAAVIGIMAVIAIISGLVTSILGAAIIVVVVTYALPRTLTVVIEVPVRNSGWIQIRQGVAACAESMAEGPWFFPWFQRRIIVDRDYTACIRDTPLWDGGYGFVTESPDGIPIVKGVRGFSRSDKTLYLFVGPTSDAPSAYPTVPVGPIGQAIEW